MNLKLCVYAFFSVILFSSCGGDSTSTEDLASEVQAHIQETWASDPDLSTASITSFTLIHKGGTQYRGLLEATQDGESVTLGVDVTYDGENMIWEISQ